MIRLTGSSHPSLDFIVCVFARIRAYAHVGRLSLRLDIHVGVQRVTAWLYEPQSICVCVCMCMCVGVVFFFSVFFFPFACLLDACLFRYAIFLRRDCEGNHLRLIFAIQTNRGRQSTKCLRNYLLIYYSAASCTMS